MAARWHVEMYEQGKLVHLERVIPGQPEQTGRAIIDRDIARWLPSLHLAAAAVTDAYRAAALDADSPEDDADLRDIDAAQHVHATYERLCNRTYRVRRCSGGGCMCRFQ